MAGERAYPAQSVPFSGGRVIASPFQFFTSGEESLRIVSANSLAGVRLTLQGRRLADTGLIEPFQFDHVPHTDRTTSTQDFPLGVGALMNLTVFARAGQPQIGQCFVVVQIVRGQTLVAVVLGTLLQGYVTSVQALGWPGSPIVSSLEGGGYQRVILGADPAAGVDITETVPTGCRWQLLAFGTFLATSATVAARKPGLYVGVSPYAGPVEYFMYNRDTQAASDTRYWNWSAGLTPCTMGPGSYSSAGLGTDVVALPGYQLGTYTELLQAGDNWQAPHITVREWLELN